MRKPECGQTSSEPRRSGVPSFREPFGRSRIASRRDSISGGANAHRASPPPPPSDGLPSTRLIVLLLALVVGIEDGFKGREPPLTRIDGGEKLGHGGRLTATARERVLGAPFDLHGQPTPRRRGSGGRGQAAEVVGERSACLELSIRRNAIPPPPRRGGRRPVSSGSDGRSGVAGLSSTTTPMSPALAADRPCNPRPAVGVVLIA